MVTEDKIGKVELLMGNHAVVRGAIEAGVRVAVTYPGTPASEIGDLFSEIRKQISTIFLSLENFIHGFGVFSFLQKKRATARKSMLLLCVIS